MPSADGPTFSKCRGSATHICLYLLAGQHPTLGIGSRSLPALCVCTRKFLWCTSSTQQKEDRPTSFLFQDRNNNLCLICRPDDGVSLSGTCISQSPPQEPLTWHIFFPGRTSEACLASVWLNLESQSRCSPKCQPNALRDRLKGLQPRLNHCLTPVNFRHPLKQQLGIL